MLALDTSGGFVGGGLLKQYWSHLNQGTDPTRRVGLDWELMRIWISSYLTAS